MRALLASHNQQLYWVNLQCVADIADHVRESHLETMTSTDGQFDFWLSPSLGPGNQRLNGPATKLLFAATQFSAVEVPLLRGNIVVSSHDVRGRLVGLTEDQMSRLVAMRDGLARRDEWVMDRRMRRVERAERRRRRAARSVDRREHWRTPLGWGRV